MEEVFAEKYLEYISKRYKIPKPKAAEFIDQCLKKTSAQLNVDYKTVYKTIFKEDFIN